jgi:hypothetical protein
VVKIGDEVDHVETRVRIKQVPVPQAKFKNASLESEAGNGN